MKTYGIIQSLNESVEDYQDKLSVKFMAKIFNQMRKDGWDGREETADEYFDKIIAKLENREPEKELVEAKSDEYEVWQRYFNEDGTTTTEYVQSFDTYEEANKFAESLAKDPNCDAWVEDTLDESEKPDNSKHAILSRVFAKYPDISEEDEDYLNSLPLDGLINEVMNRGWNDVLEESEDDEVYLANLAEEILDWYDNDMGNHFDEVEGNEKELYDRILSSLINKDVASIKAFIEDIENEGLEQDKELVDKLKNILLEESEETLIETTNRGIEDRKKALYTKTRQILKDKGDPEWENLIGLKGRLSDEELAEWKEEETEINAIEMIHSILTYSSEDAWTVDDVMSNPYMQNYIKDLGEDRVREIAQQEVDEYINNATIDRDVYTDNEGLTYSTVRFKNE